MCVILFTSPGGLGLANTVLGSGGVKFSDGA